MFWSHTKELCSFKLTMCFHFWAHFDEQQHKENTKIWNKFFQKKNRKKKKKDNEYEQLFLKYSFKNIFFSDLICLSNTLSTHWLVSTSPPPLRFSLCSRHTRHTLEKSATSQRPSTSRVHAQSVPYDDTPWHPCCILKPPCTLTARGNHTQAPHKRHSWHGDAHPMSAFFLPASF